MTLKISCVQNALIAKKIKERDDLWSSCSQRFSLFLFLLAIRRSPEHGKRLHFHQYVNIDHHYDK